MNKSYKIRTGYIFIFSCFLYFLIALNLFFLQIKQHHFYTNLANKQYVTNITKNPPRALIFDKTGTPLALNKDSITAFILPKQIVHKKELINFLTQYFPESLPRFNKKQDAYFMYIKRNLSQEEIQLIKNYALEDIYFLTEPRRFYPNPSTAGLVGITDVDNNGISGCELMFDTLLAGTPTTTILERDARSGNFYFSQQTQTEGSLGTPVQLTIDSHIQFLVQEALNAQAEKFKSKEGGVVVMDPDSGDIIAMASYPTFDPNNTHELDITFTKNTPITESYEFGSGLKTFCALAALEEKAVTANEEIDCHNTKTTIVDGRKINTVYADGIIPFSMVMQRSNNIGIAKVAKRIGSKLYDHYKKLEFGNKTGIALPGEQTGFVNHPKNWSKQSIISLSYGYEITTTLLQLTRAFCIFCNNGYLIHPRLVISPEQSTVPPTKIYSDESIAVSRSILEKITSTQEGTGKYAAVKGFRTLGKTSTANLLENGVYDPHKNFFAFIGAIEEIEPRPNHKPYKRVIGCYLKESSKHGVYASTVAAPLFQTIAETLLIHDKVVLNG